MNWFTKSVVSSLPVEKKKELVETCGGCEHVEANPEVLDTVSYENDTWGREGYCMCKECRDKAQEEINNEMVTCRDCSGTVKRKDSIEWKWYDFHRPQGDEPLVVCKECTTKDKHVLRVRNDAADRDAEFGDRDDDYYDYRD